MRAPVYLSMMNTETTFTLSSDNAKAIHEALDVIHNEGREAVSSHYLFKNLVKLSLGDKPSEQNSRMKFHRTVTLRGGILW